MPYIKLPNGIITSGCPMSLRKAKEKYLDSGNINHIKECFPFIPDKHLPKKITKFIWLLFQSDGFDWIYGIGYGEMYSSCGEWKRSITGKRKFVWKKQKQIGKWIFFDKPIKWDSDLIHKSYGCAG